MTDDQLVAQPADQTTIVDSTPPNDPAQDPDTVAAQAAMEGEGGLVNPS